MSCIVSCIMEKASASCSLLSCVLTLCSMPLGMLTMPPVDTDVPALVAPLVHGCSEMGKKTDVDLDSYGWDSLIFLVSFQQLWKLTTDICCLNRGAVITVVSSPCHAHLYGRHKRLHEDKLSGLVPECSTGE